MDSSCRMFREEPLARAMRFPSGASPTVAPNLYMELSNRSPCCIELPEGDRAMNPPDEFLKHAATASKGQVCARSKEQGDVESDGREMASVC